MKNQENQTNQITPIREEGDYITIEEVLKLLHCSKTTAIELLKKCEHIKFVKADSTNTCERKFYLRSDVIKLNICKQEQKQLQKEQKQQKQLQKEQKQVQNVEKRTNILFSKTDPKVLKLTLGKFLDNLPKDELKLVTGQVLNLCFEKCPEIENELKNKLTPSHEYENKLIDSINNLSNNFTNSMNNFTNSINNLMQISQEQRPVLPKKQETPYRMVEGIKIPTKFKNIDVEEDFYIKLKSEFKQKFLREEKDLVDKILQKKIEGIEDYERVNFYVLETYDYWDSLSQEQADPLIKEIARKWGEYKEKHKKIFDLQVKY